MQIKNPAFAGFFISGVPKAIRVHLNLGKSFPDHKVNFLFARVAMLAV